MSKLTVTTFLTLDGVMQAPGGPGEDRSGGFLHGGWVIPHADPQFGDFMDDVFGRAGAFLLGRRTYEIFAAYWPKVADTTDTIATALNRLPKYVASRTLDRAEWPGSTVIRDVVKEVSALKRKDGSELQVHGSAGLVQTLLENDLVDELNLLTFPVVLGAGKRLFGAGAIPKGYRVVKSRVTEKGIIIATYAQAGAPAYGSAA